MVEADGIATLKRHLVRHVSRQGMKGYLLWKADGDSSNLHLKSAQALAGG